MLRLVASAVALLAMGASLAAQAPSRDLVIGLLEVPELMPTDSCKAFPPATLPLYAERGGEPIGEIRGAGRPPTATVCEFPDVRVVIDDASFELATLEHGYEERSLIVTASERGWYRVLTGGTPDTAWVRPSAAGVYRPLATLFSDALTYLDRGWDRRLYVTPNGRFTRVARSAGDDGSYEQPVEVDEVRVVDGVYWAHVTFAQGCDTAPARRGRGWVRVHALPPSDHLMLWFYSRGC